MVSAPHLVFLRPMIITWKRFGRNSLDNQGGSILAIVRLGQSFPNAFFNSELNLMAFGDALPFAGALDVVGHELTHGVISNSANFNLSKSVRGIE